MELIDLIIINFLTMLIFIQCGLIFFVRKAFFNALKAKLGRGGKILVEKYYASGLKTRQVVKPKEENFFGSKDGAVAFWDKKVQYYDEETGLNSVVFVEGTLSNVDLHKSISGNDYLKQWFFSNEEIKEKIESDIELKKNLIQLDVSAKFSPDEVSRIVNQTVKRAVEFGIMIGRKHAQGVNNNLLLILLIAILGGVGIVGFLVFNNSQTMTGLASGIAGLQNTLSSIASIGQNAAIIPAA